MKNIDKLFCILFLSTGISTRVNADLLSRASSAQIVDDVRSFLKAAQIAEQQHFANYSTYNPDLTALGVKFPYYIVPYGSIKTSIGANTLSITFTGNLNSVVSGKIISINETGSILGASQFESANELNEEIKAMLLAIYAAEQSYYAEFSAYTSDLLMAGFLAPPHLTRYGRFGVNASTNVFTATFYGNYYPVVAKTFTINQSNQLNGF